MVIFFEIQVHGLSFQGKACIHGFDVSSKPKLNKSLSLNGYRVCMSAQQAGTKVLVSPLDLENAIEPPLNIYRPKEPYTATIVSVEKLVGPKAPGETCHIVINHGGSVPYWEGQSYGVIPPVRSLSFSAVSNFHCISCMLNRNNTGIG